MALQSLKEWLQEVAYVFHHLPDGPYNASTVTVFNANRLFVPDGDLNTINGFAYLTDEPGKLEVDLADTGDRYAPCK